MNTPTDSPLPLPLPLTDNARRVVEKRYLKKGADGAPAETPREMFRRVAAALAGAERAYGADDAAIARWAAEFEAIMADFKFTPAGRTLANAGAPTPLVANCIVLHIGDTMAEIFGTLRDAALLQKAGSGLGFPLHLLRPAGAPTVASGGTSSGPVSFLNVYNSAFGVIKQQGRHGANMAVMAVSHPDILEFVHCKDREGDIKNFNVSVGLTNAFMRAVAADDPAPWLCEFGGTKMLPRRIVRDANYNIVSVTPVELSARALFAEIIDSAWRSGEPGCVFLDRVNETNPLPGLGRIEACNPCGEQFLHDGDVCNLGSLNLEQFVTAGGEVDHPELARVVRLAVRMLDNVVDLSEFPVERVNRTFRDNRRLGLGIMGFADMLYKMRVAYDSPEGRAVATDVMRAIQAAAEQASEELAEEKGVFPNWGKSVFKDRGVKRRNAALTNIPPTGTISMMFDVSGGVEPYFALAYHYRAILDGKTRLQYVNKHLRRALEEAGVYSEALMEEVIACGSLQRCAGVPDAVKRVFVTSMDISPEDHTRMQAAFQAHCDNAISKTINYPNSATRDDILRGYVRAWELGCKGCTAYRDGSRQLQVLNLNGAAGEPGAGAGAGEPADDGLVSVRLTPEQAEAVRAALDGGLLARRAARGEDGSRVVDGSGMDLKASGAAPTDDALLKAAIASGAVCAAGGKCDA